MSWEATYAFETFPEWTLSIVISHELQIFVTDLDASYGALLVSLKDEVLLGELLRRLPLNVLA